ncbi:DUF1983 domain-containing protein [Candidatus Symbiopectobacterium sp. NZEC135]|nr:DUF1983 domain-containing protein [Candidatus Symbiopectobacterium sp. NZEC135]
MTAIKGSKGGSANARVPVESPDSIQSTSYAKILLALGEGEFAGNLDGSRIFLDGTPLNDSNGNANFSGVSWAFRPGTPDQSYIPGFPGVENEIAVSTELTSKTPWTRLLPNINLSAVRMRFSWAALQQQHDNGDVGGYRIEYAIDIATDGGSYREVLKTAIDGKTTTSYERSHRIDLPTASTGWQIRVRRITPNSTSNRIADKMAIEAITEVIDAKLRYPETALLLMQFDAQQFQNIPVISCEPDGRIIRVPTNYDAQTRRYSGSWDGTFKWAFSNNPAWVYYDIQLSERFGLGERIKATHLVLSKWTLYQIAQYCDQLVPDGHGGSGTEPRFLCDVYIQSQEEAWTVLNDLAAIFRGSSFWANNQMNVLADMPREMDYVVTRANVRDGRFTYSNASSKTHYSTAMVAWSDPDNAYQDAVEAVADNKLVRRYGIKQADVTAIGCTRQTEAIRRGKWILHTNDADRTVSYTMGLDGDIPVPGAIVGIADALLAGRPLGGRISAVDGRNITLDRVSSAAIGERLILNLPSGKAEGRTIEAVNDKVVTVTTAYSETPVPESVWAVDANDLALQQYRVIGVKEGEDSTSFDITAIEFDPDKFAKIDTGARIESRPISLVPPSVQPAPNNVAISGDNRIEQGITITTLRITWDKADSAIAYEVQWRRDNGNWISAARTSALGVDVPGIYAGRYQARVRAINATEISSLWANAQETTLTGKVGNPPALLNLSASTDVVFSIDLSWMFGSGSEDGLKTTLMVATAPDYSDEMFLADVPYPQRNYSLPGKLTPGQILFFRAIFTDKLGNESDSTEWVRGMATNDASTIKDLLKEAITETQLSKELLEKINSLPSDVNVNDLANQITQAQENITKNRAELQGEVESVRESTDILARSTIEWSLALNAEGKERREREAWIIKQQAELETDQQSIAEDVTQLGANFDEQQAALTHIDRTVSDNQKSVVESLERLESRASENETSIERLDRVFSDEIESSAQQIDRLKTDVEGNKADILNEQKARSTADEALGQRISSFAAVVGENQASVDQKIQVLSDAGSAQAKKIDDLSSSANENRAAVTELQEALSNNTGATASLTQSLDAIARSEVQHALDNESDFREQEKKNASILTSQRVIANDQESLAEELSSLEANHDATSARLLKEESTRASETEALSKNVVELTANIESSNVRIAREESTRATADESLSKSILELSSSFDSNKASLTQKIESLATDNSAQTGVINQLKTQVGNNSSELEQRMQTVFDKTGAGKSIYTLKMGVNVDGEFYDVGMALGVEVVNGVVQRQFLVNASTFGVMNNEDGNISMPFVIQDGRMVVDNAMLGKAVIGRLQLTDYLESDNYVSGRSGLRLDLKNGNLVMNSESDGYSVTLSSKGLKVYDENKDLIVEVGIFDNVN